MNRNLGHDKFVLGKVYCVTVFFRNVHFNFPELHLFTWNMSEEEEEGGGKGGDGLEQLAMVGLLGRVWPPERVWLGMRSCKYATCCLVAFVVGGVM